VSVIPPLVKEVVVSCPPEEAFAVFTAGVHRWWPLADHSVGGAASRALVLDEHAFVETLPDGTPCRWGTVLAWEPPTRLSMTWHPGHGPDRQTQVDVTFEATPAGTRVRLVHTGWENLGLPATEDRAEYDEGWGLVLGRLVESIAEAARH
jgi:uncharacterized protein YndB with AHSA1/START domain